MLVRAGAGTGKTTVLVERIARLIRGGQAQPEEILAITYSNNAADELRERVLRILGPDSAQVEAGKMPLPRVSKTSAPPLSRDETIERCREIAATFHAVEDLLRRQGLGTFGHMISDAVRLLRADAEWRQREQRSARFLLIDEFQDANLGQIELAYLLAGDYGNVFAVGDPDQAIYQFRGASSAAFDEFLRRYPAAKQVTLTGSQRSTGRILGAATPQFSA